MIPKTEAFLNALVELCKQHGCELSGSFAVHRGDTENDHDSVYDISNVSEKGVEIWGTK